MKLLSLLKMLVIAIGLASVSAHSLAAQATVAVASNFTKTIEAVYAEFVKTHPQHKLRFAFGPTGKLFAQIKNGAPFDAFFAADEQRAKLAIQQAAAMPTSYFVYAQGKIVLYSKQHLVAERPLMVLQQANFRHLAIANPKTAPYGERAQTFLQKQGVYAKLKAKIVKGESVAHAFQYVATGNAEIGFIALSQVVDPQSPLYQKGQYWVVPQTEYAPINQGAVITKRGANNEAIRDFMQFMQSPTAEAIIQNYGYGVS